MNQCELMAKFAKYGNAVFKVDKANYAFMFTLIAYWNYQTGECFPSNDSVHRGCGLSQSNLVLNKKVLTKAGLITPYMKRLGDGLKHSGYKIHTDFIAEKIEAYEAELAVKEVAELNQSNAEIFEPEPEQQQAPIEEKSNPFEVSPIDPSEPVSAPVEPTHTELVKAPYSGLNPWFLSEDFL